MFPTPDPHNAPRPDPEESPLRGGGAPEDPHIRLAAANLRHVRTFEERCQEKGLAILTLEESEKLTQPFGQIFSNVVSQHPAWLPKIEHPLILRILRAAEGATAYHILGWLTDPAETRSYFLDIPYSIAPLEPGNSAVFNCIVPRALIEGIPDPDDEATRSLSFQALLDTTSLERELASIDRGTSKTLLHTVVNCRLIDQDRAPEQILRVDRSFHRHDSLSALLVRLPSGTALIEIAREPATGAATFSDLYFLAPGTRPPQDFFYDERSSDAVRSHLLADLSARELEPMIEVDWVQSAKWMFGRALANSLVDTNIAVPVSVEIKQLLAKREGPYIFDLVAEAQLRQDDRSFLVPTHEGAEMLRSPEPASLFFALAPHETPSGERHVSYRLSHLALPPCGGIEGVIEAMTKSPDRSILTEPMVALIGTDLDLNVEEIPSLKLTAVIPLTIKSEGDSIELTGANAHNDREPVLVLCSHTKGAHIFAINRHGSGLLHVIDDIVPLHFFAPVREA